MLRAGLLEGTVVATAGGADAAAAACARLGATTVVLEVDLLDEEAVGTAVAGLGPVGTLVCDAAPAFVAAGGGIDGLAAGLEGAWNAARAVTNAIWRPGEGGRLVLLGARSRDGAHAAALGAALENLARTLSIEWARYGIRSVAVLPADATSDDEVAQLIGYLASPAGDYFSGCVFAFSSGTAAR
jgi:NAD(P)-dependent dehydrogenase (short-subunit alcohol dehydrogenase family)